MSVDNSVLLPYLAKVDRNGSLSDAAREAFLALPLEHHTHGINRDIIKQGDCPTRSCLIVEGVVSRHKTLRNGKRQISSFHFPGDMVDLHASLLTVADSGIRTHTPTTIVTIACKDILGLAAEYPEWGRAFWFDTLVDASVFREWTLNLGQRTAVARVAHLLLEISVRLERIGQSDGRSFVLPVTQADLADAVGLSAVHTNRSIQQLRQSGTIRTQGREVMIEDYQSLVSQALLDPSYLHPEGPRQWPELT